MRVPVRVFMLERKREIEHFQVYIITEFFKLVEEAFALHKHFLDDGWKEIERELL